MPNSSASSGRPIDSAEIALRAEQIPWAELEQIVHLDPAGRGLASFRRDAAPLDAGQLRAASVHLALNAQSVGIVTGFPVMAPGGVVAETDGPPGALFLARSLAALGVDVFLISDRVALPLLDRGVRWWQLKSVSIVEMPLGKEPGSADRWADALLSTPRGRGLSHLIAIERPSPSHTLASLAAQGASPESVSGFAAAVPAEHRGVCHNMRGDVIEAHTAEAHRLFEMIAERKIAVTTIGIGDGGNEIGMGRFDWQTLVEAVGSPSAARIAARMPTDYAIIAGVSNWGGYALALATARLCDAVELGRDWNVATQQTLIETMVRETDAVDGLTHRHEATIDGLPLEVYLQPLAAMRKLLGYDEAS
jgi:hypothetical protein